MAENADMLSTILKQFQLLSSDLDCYIDPPKSLSGDLVNLTKYVFDFMKRNESKLHKEKCKCPLEAMIVNGFDYEQIWQEIQLQNEPFVRLVRGNMKQLISKTESFEQFCLSAAASTKVKGKSSTTVASSNNEYHGETNDFDSEQEEHSDQFELMYNEDDSNHDRIPTEKLSSKKKSIVDDNFFSLASMEAFLDMEDKKELKKQSGELSDDEEIDYFADVASDDEEESDDDGEDWGEAVKAASDAVGRSVSDLDRKKSAREMMYTDFFDPPETGTQQKSKRVTFEDKTADSEKEVSSDVEMLDEEDDDEEAVSDDVQEEKESLSTHETEMKKRKDRIKKLEEANIAEKPWQLKGEVTSSKRPVNSLLEEHVTFDYTSTGAPVITEETTETLETIIKQRIKDEAWDDVIRKEKQVLEPYEYKKAPTLDQEKSKLSLAEVYEKEYLKQTREEEEEKENEDHVVIRNMMTKLFSKLDALSNFHFTPKPPKPELTIVANVPSLQLEEVVPITASNSAQLAPEEIHDKQRTEIKGTMEMTDTDRKRERREKKLRKRRIAKEKETRKNLAQKLNPRLEDKYNKQEALEKLKKSGKNTITSETETVTDLSLKSSTAFFTRLQEEAKSDISRKREHKMKGRKSDKKARIEQMKL